MVIRTGQGYQYGWGTRKAYLQAGRDARASQELYEISILGMQDTDNEHFLKSRRMVHLVGKRIPGYLVYLSRP